jgi:tRNA-specific 2-thiouridylase
MKKKVAIGLSGGIDSSVAAYLLKKRGFDVVGLTLKFYPEQNSCCDWQSLYQAKRLCAKLNIIHHVADATDLFKKKIVDYFINSYLEGLTPNPCARCNRLIKFDFLFEEAKALGADYLATGHYARIGKRGDKYFLRRNRDEKKTQEYFLGLLKPEVLKHIIFPLANYTKEEVKKIAKDKSIVFKERKESQDICFARGRPYAEFIKANIAKDRNYTGSIKHIDGRLLGKHKGIYHYTYGQRGGLGVSWHKPLYVAAIDSNKKEVIVAEKEYLDNQVFFVNSLNWFLSPKNYKDLKVKVRYNSNPVSCDLRFMKDKAEVRLHKSIDFLAPGQVAAFYSKDLLLGAGIIEKR